MSLRGYIALLPQLTLVTERLHLNLSVFLITGMNCHGMIKTVPHKFSFVPTLPLNY